MRFRSSALSTATAFTLSLALPSSVKATSFTFPVAGANPTSVAVTNVDQNVVVSAPTVGTGTTTASSSKTGTFVSFPASANASTNLLTGDLKVDGSASFGFFANARGWDFLTFDGTGSVDFAFAVDGTLRNGLANGMVSIAATVWLLDVSTWTSYSGTDAEGAPIVAVNGTGSPVVPTDYRVAGTTFDSRAVRGATSTACTTQFITNCAVNSAGTVLDGDLALSGTWAVDSSKLYLLYLSLTASTFNGAVSGPLQVADFSHTGTFDFTNLNGLTFQSASGEFLSQAAAPIPEPASLLLLGTGLGGSWIARRRASKADRQNTAA